ncbi:Ger(x)C family spore germination protein [Bacillus sp. ISL-18]|uniref:Ger(x)C family spore germination protein n=1 Tax=Bacillus sp. ISL-18 TaxID=2819118 RepID=UPI001BE6A851|nr:Ger(x)C family spore germination protein [Bacillus sp. ISL-18]MBT2658469.1 Ger(x)C family spore germination protein [Bacillus sp. ISL-18]
MKKAVFCCACLLLLTGCWDRTELKELGIVMGVAVDKDSDSGEYIVTSQLLRPGAISTQMPSTEKPVEEVVTSGKTIFEAIRKSNLEFDRKGFYAHAKVIVISENLAKEGLLPVLDFFQRGKEIRGYVFVCIAKNTQASKVLGIETGGIQNIPAIRIRDMIEDTRFQLKGTKINLLNFYKESIGSGIEPVVGVLQVEKDKFEKKHVKMSGGAVFNKDKLVGYLNAHQTIGYRWCKSEVESGAVSLPSPINENRYESVEVKKAKTTIKPLVKGKEISFTINVTGEGNITEQEVMTSLEDSTKKLEHMKMTEEKMEKQIEKDIKLAVEKAQKEFHSDIFGFGRALNKEKPKVWNIVKKDWNDRFAEVPYTVKVHFKINSTELMRGPFQAKN